MQQESSQVSCLVLFSGGLDSILACRLLENRGIKVTAIKFITPFFGSGHIGREDAAAAAIYAKYGIDCRVIDISEEYLEMVADPPHGYGKHMNPCIDCKILMIRKTLDMLDDYGASFVATGEVPGQRPMSQRNDVMRLIERESGAEGMLLRPLAASLFKPVRAELEGLFSSSGLPAITGRGRKEQMKLARQFGISDYPTPAGGCVLADPLLGKRFGKLFLMKNHLSVNDCLLARTGRHFMLPEGGWLTVGRNRKENGRIRSLLRKDDLFIRLDALPGPEALLRSGRVHGRRDILLAAGIVARYASKRPSPAVTARIAKAGQDGSQDIIEKIEIEPAGNDLIDRMRF